MTQITIDPVDGGWLKVTFPYDPGAVAIIKSAVPAEARSWNAAQKLWMVREKWGNTLTEAMIAGGHSVGAVMAEPAVEFWTNDDVKVEAKARARAIIDDIPRHLRGKVFREMAKILYPDMYRGPR